MSNISILYFLSSVGLISDIIGVIMVFKYVIEPPPMGTIPSTRDINKFQLDEKTKRLRIKKRAKIGLYLIVIGFLFQFISTFYQAIFPQ